jgi:iron complex transport system ATP-binding protein
VTVPAVDLHCVRVEHPTGFALRDLSWTVRTGERWVVLGPNGSGKTTLLRIAALRLHPSSGEVDVLGERLGRTDVRTLRTRIGFTSAAVADLLRPTLTVHDVVLTARRGALEPWWHTYDDADHTETLRRLDEVGAADLDQRTFGSLSSGERQRVLLARSLVADPGLLLLDEPAAGLDFGGREQLVSTLGRLATDPTIPPTVLVTHHLEEVPPHFTHALLLRDGRTVASGAIDDTLDAANLSDAFGVDVAVDRHGDRWSARVTS